MSKQRIPLRVLSEFGGSRFTPLTANTASAPSIGRPGQGSLTSGQIKSFTVGHDCVKISSIQTLNLAAGAGFVIPSVTGTFPNIPVTQDNSVSTDSGIQVTNQNYSFSAPQETIFEYYVMCHLNIIPTTAGGVAAPVIMTPWVNAFAKDVQGTKYNIRVNGIAAGVDRLPPNVVFNSFNYTTGANIMAFAAVPSAPYAVSWDIKAYLFITYPSGNPS